MINKIVLTVALATFTAITPALAQQAQPLPPVTQQSQQAEKSTPVVILPGESDNELSGTGSGTRGVSQAGSNAANATVKARGERILNRELWLRDKPLWKTFLPLPDIKYREF